VRNFTVMPGFSLVMVPCATYLFKPHPCCQKANTGWLH